MIARTTRHVAFRRSAIRQACFAAMTRRLFGRREYGKLARGPLHEMVAQTVQAHRQDPRR